MTDNGGEQYGSPGDGYEPRQQEQGSWFTPSGDRYLTQSQYQDGYSQEQQGDTGGAEGEAPEVPPDRAGTAGTAFSGFPDTGGYPGLSAERPGMAEPYPTALGGPDAPPTGPLPPVNRPYTAPGMPSSKPSSAPEADHGADTMGSRSGEAPGGAAYGSGARSVPTGNPLRDAADPFPTAEPAPIDARQPEHRPRTDVAAFSPPSAPTGADTAPSGEGAGPTSGAWPTRPEDEHRKTGVYRVPTGERPAYRADGATAAPLGGAEGTGGYPGFGASMRRPGPDSPPSAAAPEWVRPVPGTADAPSAPAYAADRPTRASGAGPESGREAPPDAGTAGEVSGGDHTPRNTPVASYDDELSRPYSDRIPMEAPEVGRAPWAASTQERSANRSVSGDSTAARGETGDGLGTGSGNTWAFSRDDDRLPDNVREAAAKAQEKRRDGSPDHTTQVFRSDVGVPSAGGTSTSPEGIPVPPVPDDPLSVAAAQQAQVRAQEISEASDDSGGWPVRSESGFGGGGQGTQAVSDELGPDLRSDELGSDLRGYGRDERPQGYGSHDSYDSGGWPVRSESGFGGGGQGTQAMPAVSDELGPDSRGDGLGPELRGTADADPRASGAAEAPTNFGPDGWSVPSEAGMAGTGQGTQAMPAVSDELGPDLRSDELGPDLRADEYGDRGPGTPGNSAGEYRPTGTSGHGYGGVPAEGIDGHGAFSAAGYGEAPGAGEFDSAVGYADPAAQDPAAYGMDTTAGYAEPGYAGPGGGGPESVEQGAPQYGPDLPDQGYADRGFAEGDPAGRGYGPDHPDSPYADAYPPEPGAMADDEARQRRGRSGRARVAEEFPGFEDPPFGGAAGDPYPGYDNIDYWPETAPGATATLWLGIIGLVPLIGLFTAVAALFTGPSARRGIQRSGGELEGLNLVKVGTALAWFGIGLFLVEVVVGLGSLLFL